ncbi:MAG: transglycosylase SLT domain-containing protein [Acidimicrobiales bacterium]
MRTGLAGAAIIPLVVGLSCGSTSSETVDRALGEPAASTAAREAVVDPIDDGTGTSVTPTTTAAPEPTVPVRAFNGRAVPNAPRSAEEASAAFTRTVSQLRRDETDPALWPDLGHELQLTVRMLSRNPEWHEAFLAGLPLELRRVADLHLQARAELGSLHTAPPLTEIPAWEIIDPLPIEALLGHYEAAEEAAGIAWEVLAAINLIETGMGRIDGLSSAGAQGPMQFLPSTWEEVSEGGDIDDPADAIPGAARYLVRRGGLDDIRAGLWGYNNSDNYVNAVLAYVEILEEEPKDLRGLHGWEIYVGTEAGTLWLPVGFRTEEPLDAHTYLAKNPWAITIR